MLNLGLSPKIKRTAEYFSACITQPAPTPKAAAGLSLRPLLRNHSVAMQLLLLALLLSLLVVVDCILLHIHKLGPPVTRELWELTD